MIGGTWAFGNRFTHGVGIVRNDWSYRSGYRSDNEGVKMCPVLGHLAGKLESTDAEAEHRIAVLYQEFGGPLLRHVRKSTGNDLQWAEDVVQETIVRAWRHSARLQWEPSLIWAWLLTVARRIVIDGRRRKSVRPHEVEPPEVDMLAVPDGSERALSAMVVADALRSLSEEHREVIEQTYLRDRTINEAAEILGIPPGTVKSRLYYGIRALRVLLRDKGVAG
ncbi:sigma-70 family RNA polymerase sigma factor [Nonomuraea aurantiaca]|uniref:sigma-70 family RNA polymerase sigma factor n=2 Tax=Nonomuraea TaxID=83681 RepID=UPI001CD967CD|nr:sigma-70 family RNA polymerase sigma factor [Nonomuraea aurantiaca]MCA2225505.1 sigma-70 family RNA polymerase sigma factor [Nonomuraea aurantiaca]